MITFEQAKQLKHGQVIHYYNDSKGKCECWRVSGKVQLWKTRPNEIKIPIKYGLYGNSYLTHDLLNMVHLAIECPLELNRRLTIAECKDLKMNKEQLCKHYGLKNFDYAIPESLFAELIKGTDLNIFHFVYSYDNNSFGELYPLTIEAENRMKELGWEYLPIESKERR